MFSKKLFTVVLSVLGVSILASSCKREKDDNILNNEETAYAEEQLILEQVYNNADRVVERALTLGEGSLKGGENPLGGCAVIMTDSTDDSMVLRMTIEFGGSTTCLGFDGRYRTGKIIVYYKHGVKMNEDGYYRKTIFNMYAVDGHRVGGHKEMWYTGLNPSGNPEYAIASTDTIYLPDNTGKVTGASQRTREWYSGSETPQSADDVFRLTGFGNFIRPTGEKYYVEIAKPLADALNCNWINEGVTNIYPEKATQRVLDYGEGDCDNDAIINVNGVKRIAKIP